METSPTIAELATALAKAQAVMAGAKKDTANPFFKSKYADLASVWEACRKALTDNGIAVVQMTRASEKDEVVVITRLCHSSGEWMQGELAMPVSKHDAQGYGSAMTYTRRYALAAAVGVAPEEDDGNAAAAAKPLSKAVPANVEGQDVWAKLDAGTRDMLSEVASSTIALAKEGRDAHGFLESYGFDHETKLALWTQLPSDVRATIKKQAPKQSLATQP